MGSSGYVDWHRLDVMLPWARIDDEQHTYVYAFWLVDYGTANRDHGVGLLKSEGRHPDWFLHADTADHVLAAYTTPTTWISPNFRQVFDNQLSAAPLIAAVLLGTADTMYQTSYDGRLWWCDRGDLTWGGKRLLRRLDRLYERTAILVTFLDRPTDENSSPRDPR